MHTDLRPYRAEYLTNPTQEQLRKLTLECTPSVQQTGCGNLNKISRNKARMAKYTYVIGTPDRASEFSAALIDPDRAAELIAAQKAYIEEIGKLIEVQRYVGIGPRAAGVQWLYTPEGANIAGMQSILAFSREDAVGDAAFEARFRVVYTPDHVPDIEGGQAILVDLDDYVTYVMGPDYFGESKKGALRMLNKWAFGEGALVLHAGAKSVQLGDHRISMTIMGLSGTGKTTTTFSKQGDVTQPIQDDMVTLWPNGEMTITENGCFAKTFGLTEKTEPVIYRGTLSAEAWVENAYTNVDGSFDFFKKVLSADEVERWRPVLLQTGADPAKVDRYISGEVTEADVRDTQGVLADGWEFVEWTGNGRSIIPMSSVEDAADLHDLPAVESMGILNRDEGADACTPGIVRFTSPEQAAGFFMLGETTKTSAAGKDVGKTRSPFTQPFFPLAHGLQAKRFSELVATMPKVTLWMMNTGYVGGDQAAVDAGAAHKVKIRHSSAMLEAMLTDQIAWKTDPDFGYEVVDVEAPANAPLLEAVPADILDPASYYARSGKAEVYRTWVRAMKAQRRTFLESYDVDEAIIAATCD